MADSTAAAFFDMDHTIVLGNTGRMYAESLRDRGEIDWRHMVRMSSIMLRYRLSVVDMNEVMRSVVSRLQGTPVEELRDRCVALFDERIRPKVSAAAVEAIEGHRRLGHRVVLLTAQTTFMAEPLCRHLRIEDSLCTRLEVEEGRLTGSIVGPACYGDGKRHWAARYADEHGVDLDRSYFYTDSYSDLPMLEAVAYRRVVNPDARLRLHATLRRWPVLRFSR